MSAKKNPHAIDPAKEPELAKRVAQMYGKSVNGPTPAQVDELRADIARQKAARAEHARKEAEKKKAAESAAAAAANPPPPPAA